MPPEHGDLVETDSPTSTRGNHILQGFADVADEAARAALVQVTSDEGRVVLQTGGVAPGLYVAGGVTASWSRVGYLHDLTPAVETLTGEVWGGKAVYRQHFSGTTGANGSVTEITSSGDIEQIIAIRGSVDRVSAAFGQPWGGGSILNSTDRVICRLDRGTDNIELDVDGTSFDVEPYELTVDYTKI